MQTLTGAAFLPHPPLAIPSVGGQERSEIQQTLKGYEKAGDFVKKHAPDTIVVLTPHGPFLEDALCITTDETISGDMEKFGVKGESMTLQSDVEFANSLLNNLRQAEISAIPLGKYSMLHYGIVPEIDHGTYVPIYYIMQAYQPFKVVVVSVGLLDSAKCRRIGALIAQTAKALNRQALIVASGDLSHKLKKDAPYGYESEGPLFDSVVVNAFENEEYETLFNINESVYKKAAECGRIPFLIGLGAFEDLPVFSEVYSYEGPFGVGYMTAVMGLAQKETTGYAKLARAACAHFIKTGQTLAWEDYPALARDQAQVVEEAFINEAENRKAGAFVSIHTEEGALRGCIGTIAPTSQNAANEVICNSISASMYDPRFEPVKQSELATLSFKVDILGEPEKIDSVKALDVKKYGVIVEKGGQRGLLLPDLDGIETVAQQVAVAMQKAGIDTTEGMSMYRFRVERYV